MCDNLKTDRVKCDVCRTINLAKPLRQEKPDMQVYEKCSPVKRVDCSRISEVPLHPTCIKVCTKEEFSKRHQKPKVLSKMPPYAHGKILWAVKAGLLVGSVYFTYTQGVWGDQQDVTECILRWQEYMRSINTRRPPTFDQCGNIVKSDTPSSMVAPIYSMYKTIVTTCFAGVVKVPLLIKCAYIDYLNAMEKKWQEHVKERNIRRNSPK